MVFNLFLNFFRNDVKGSFEKRISCFDKSPFNFSFLFYEKLNSKRYTSIRFNSFLRKSVVDIQNNVSKNSSSIVDNINRISVFRRFKINNLIL